MNTFCSSTKQRHKHFYSQFIDRSQQSLKLRGTVNKGAAFKDPETLKDRILLFYENDKPILCISRIQLKPTSKEISALGLVRVH